MIATILKGYIYDIAVSLFFDNLKQNLFTGVVKKATMIGNWVSVTNCDGDLVTEGVIIDENEIDMIILDDEDGYKVSVPIHEGGYIFTYDIEDVSDEELEQWLEFKSEEQDGEERNNN